MERRKLLKGAVGTVVLGATLSPRVFAQLPPPTPGPSPSQSPAPSKIEGTPLQFAPKTPPDPQPLVNELQKYPKCPYCGMDRTEYNTSRHLVHYDDDLVDGTCSLHCAALSLSLNMDRGPKEIYVADYGSTERIKPMVNVDTAYYLIGSKIKPVMTTRSKVAFASEQAAKTARSTNGGKIARFEEALAAAHEDMTKDTLMIRKRRTEKKAARPG